MSVHWLVRHTMRTTFTNLQNMHKNAVNHNDPSNHDDPDDHGDGSREFKMCMKVLKRPVSALYYKIISIYTTIHTYLKLL